MGLFLHQIWRNVSFHHCLRNGSSAVNGCCQNESWLKHHNNPQVIHTTPVHQLTSWEDRSCVFVRNKSIIKTFLTSNHHFQLKCESIITLPPVKKSSPVVSHIKIHSHIYLELFWTVLACKRCLICADFSPDSDKMTFSPEESYYGF